MLQVLWLWQFLRSGSEIQSAIMYIIQKVMLLRWTHPVVSGKTFSVFLKRKYVWSNNYMQNMYLFAVKLHFLCCKLQIKCLCFIWFDGYFTLLGADTSATKAFLLHFVTSSAFVIFVRSSFKDILQQIFPVEWKNFRPDSENHWSVQFWSRIRHKYFTGVVPKALLESLWFTPIWDQH